MKGYIYIENGVPVFNEKPKPEMKDYRLILKGQEIVSNAAIRRFGHALKQWQDSCVKVDNFYEYWSQSKKHYILPYLYEGLIEITPGTQATIEGNTIIDLTR